MRRIDSRANPLFRQWLKEKSRAGKHGSRVWLEGPHLCQSWLDNHHHADWLIIDEDSLSDPQIQDLIDQVHENICIVLGRGLFDALSEVKAHQGILLLGHLPEQVLPTELAGSVVILDAIQDPGNVGSILRSCAATGVSTVFTTPHTAACWSPKVLRSAQGAHAGIKIHEHGDVAGWLSEYRQHEQRLPVIATTLQNASGLYNNDLPPHAIWIFGSEGQGVSLELVQLADRCIKIEHSQQFVESLNVGIAAALCLFEQQRQHIATAK